MSVWSSACYNIEPLRNCINNLNAKDVLEYPYYLSGVCNFTFGDCGDYHPELSNWLAHDLFSGDRKVWERIRGTISKRKSGTPQERLLFRNTLEATNVRYSGLKAVYWAYAHLTSGEIVLSTNLEEEPFRAHAKVSWELAGVATRANAAAWNSAFETFWPQGGTRWFKAEAQADGAAKAWTTNRSASYRRFGKNPTCLVERASAVYDVRLIPQSEAITDKAEEEILRVRREEGYQAAAKLATDGRVRACSTNPLVVKELATVPHVQVDSGVRWFRQYRFNGGYIYYNSRKREGAIFFKKDHDRLVQMLKSRAQLLKYYANYTNNQPGLNSTMEAKFLELEKLFLDKLDPKDPDFANWVCRAFDVTQFIYLASLADDLWDRASRDQKDKVKKEGLDKYVDIEAALRVVEDEELGVKEALELLKFYKIFPCPDFCVFSAVNSFKEKSSKPNSAQFQVNTAPTPATPSYPITTKDEFWAYTMRSRALVFHATHGYLPGKTLPHAPGELAAYPNMSPGFLKVEHMQYIDFRGAFRFRRYDGCEDELVKDKSTAPTKEEPSDVDRNQVLQYLFDPNFLSQSEVNKVFAMGDLSRFGASDILLRHKPEAKKPGSRLFSMANDPARRQCSELEANIAVYAKHMRGSSQGKSTMDLDASLSKISKCWDPTVEEVLMSFDLAAFSPKQAPELKAFAYDTWAYCFDEPDTLNTRKIFTDSTVKFDMFGISDTWKLEGNDLEGFNARMNTVLHVEIMSYCVYKLKMFGVIQRSADLEVLIDDGLLKLSFPKKDFDRNWRYATRFIEKVYQSFGLEISWDKTFVSQVMCQYLNRVYYDGAEVTPGAKAYMRIGKVAEVAIPTLADELESHAAATRGAIQSGSNHLTAYFAYVFEFWLSIYRWSKYSKAVWGSNDILFRVFLPVGLSGFGMNSLFGLSTNEAFDSLVSALGNCRMIIYAYPKLKPIMEHILKAGVRPMNTEELLRSGTSLRSNLRCLNTRRFANVAKTIIMNRTTNPLLQVVVSLLTDVSVLPTIAALDKVDVMHEVTRTRVWKVGPMPFMEKVVAKLQSSTTAMRVIGPKRVAGILIINRAEARKLIDEATRGIFVKRMY